MSANVTLQPGDWVRRRPYAGGRPDVFQIEARSSTGNWLATDRAGGHSEENLELVIRGAEPPRHAASLRVGDIVRIHGDQGRWRNLMNRIPSPYVDTTVTYEGTHEAAVDYRNYIVTDQDGDWPFEFVRRPLPEQDPEQIEDEEVGEGNLAFDSYHPSMLPMLGRIARLAESRSWCSEFDSVLSEIGAPDRHEIIRITAPPKQRFEIKRYEVTEFIYTFEADDEDAARVIAHQPIMGLPGDRITNRYNATTQGNPLPPTVRRIDN